MNQKIDPDLVMEELVLKESIVGTTGLNSDTLQVGIKGDPSLRETALARQKHRNAMDEIFPTLEPLLEDLLLNRGIYRLYVGFNSAEVRTCSIFDPLREETHVAEKMIETGYLDRHFPTIEFDEKVQGIRDVYQWLMESRLFARLPSYWQRISQKRRADWRPMDREEVPLIISSLQRLRDVPGYFLRNVSVCLVQGLVRMQFNCDGTQLVSAKNYSRFLEENFPPE